TTFALSNNGQLQAFYRNALQGPNPIPLTIDVPPSNAVTRVGVGDFDGNGLADVITMSPDGSLLVFMRTAEDKLQYNAGLSAAMTSNVSAPGAFAISAMEVGDADGDGLADLLVARSNELFLFNNQ